jgi:tRNA(Ile)-lysidine synthase
MMRYLVAVSGGVDSVVLLHKLAGEASHELIVAHFDHGIRPESDADARFVQGLAASYKLAYETRREELGAQASEATARSRRYAFLYDMAKKHNAVVVTAHHGDDLIETIAINFKRGTGWRGLAVLDNPAIIRPLLPYSKSDMYEYAIKHRLEWVEDETNASDMYLRNRLRRLITSSLSQAARESIVMLWQQQVELKRTIIREEQALFHDKSSYSRYFFTHISSDVATELLRFLTDQGITRPQAQRALHAIKTAQPGTVSELGAGIRLKCGSRDFSIQTP